MDGMNERQEEAILTTEGPLLVIAGAGSGKTRVLTHRIAYLISELDVNPFNIMAITFTNKAAGEMRERIDNIVGMGSESIWVMTFHSTCVRILRRHIDKIGYDNNFTIYDSDDSKSLMKGIFKKLQIDSKQIKESSVLKEISRAKDELLSPYDYQLENMHDFGKKKYAECYIEYQETLKKNNALDFDDLIRVTVMLFKECPEVLEYYQKRFKYIMVDEYQDTNTAQFELISLLAAGSRNLCVVGDDDQSIYRFRGANIQNILNFEKIYKDAKVVKLEQNYRSTKTILDAANAVISHNRGRKVKALWTDREDDEPIIFKKYDTGREEAEDVACEIARMKKRGLADYGDIAILYRTNAQSREFEEFFVRENIPYQMVGGVNFYARKEIKDLLSYLKTVNNARDDLAVKRIINVPKRGIGASSITKLQDYADANNVSFFTACERASEVTGLGKSAEKISNFAKVMHIYRERLNEYSIYELMDQIIEDTAYIEMLEQADEDSAQERVENINELLTKIKSYEDEHPECTLDDFLEEIALVSDLDDVEGEAARVIMMTIHAAKGLEFPRVYLTGMEDGMFPSYISINSGSDDDIEEERRLAYVAITRAKDLLTITYAKSRMVRGETQYNPVSRFVKEIPAEYLKGELPKEKKDPWDNSRNVNPVFKQVQTGFSGSYSSNSYNKNSGIFDFDDRRNNVSSNSSSSQNSIYKKKALDFLNYIDDEPKSKPAPVTMSDLKKGNEFTSNELDYAVGDQVVHVKFGVGLVKDIVKGPRDYQVTVEFAGAGVKVMYAAFAKLKKL